MFDYNPGPEADNAIQQLVESLALVLPRELGISEIIPGCEITDMDPQSQGDATIPRPISIRVGQYIQQAIWRGNPPLDVGGDCLVVHSREGDIYEVVTVSGTGTCSTAELLLHHWVYDVSEGVILHFDTIAAALAYGALTSGDYVFIRPGTFNEPVAQQNDVVITQIVPGSVILHYTGGDTCVTCVNNGYLNVKEIHVTRGAGNNVYCVDATGLGANEEATVRAELIRGVQTGATGAERSRIIRGGGSGTLHIYGRIETDYTGSGGGSENGAVYCASSDTFYIHGDVFAEFAGTAIFNTYGVGTYSSGDCTVYGHINVDGDEWCAGVVVNDGGDAIVYGDSVAQTSASGSSAYGADCLQGTITVYGNCSGIAASTGRGAAVLSALGTLEVFGNCYGEETGGAGTGYGAYCSLGNLYTHGDIEGVDGGGNSYGGYCNSGDMFSGFGRATGGTFDVERAGGTFQISMLDFDSYSGTITQEYPMVDDAWIGKAGGAGGRITFDDQAVDIFNVVAARFGIDAAAAAAMLHVIQDSATGAIPAMQAKQDDISEPVLYVDSDADNDIEIVELNITGSPKWRWDETLDLFEFTHELRTTTSLYRRYYHLAIESFNPGASGATWVDPDANTVGGYRQTASSHDLLFGADVHPDWDGASDLEVEVYFELGVAGSAPGDVVVLDLEVYYKGTGEAVTKNQSLSDTVTVDASAQYTMFKAEFTIDYDAVGNVVDAGDIFRFVLTLDTANSDVDNVIINHGSFNYQTTHVGIEAGDV